MHWISSILIYSWTRNSQKWPRQFLNGASLHLYSQVWQKSESGHAFFIQHICLGLDRMRVIKSHYPFSLGKPLFLFILNHLYCVYFLSVHRFISESFWSPSLLSISKVSSIVYCTVSCYMTQESRSISLLTFPRKWSSKATVTYLRWSQMVSRDSQELI